MGVVDIDVDKVADMVVKIPNEDFAEVTLAIGHSCGDDVWGGDGVFGHEGGPGGRRGGRHGWKWMKIDCMDADIIFVQKITQPQFWAPTNYAKKRKSQQKWIVDKLA